MAFTGLGLKGFIFLEAFKKCVLYLTPKCL